MKYNLEPSPLLSQKYLTSVKRKSKFTKKTSGDYKNFFVNYLSVGFNVDISITFLKGSLEA